MLHGLGIRTGVDLDKVVAASAYLAGVRGAGPGQQVFRGGASRRRILIGPALHEPFPPAA